MIVKPVKTKIFKENENLLAFIQRHIPRLSELSILVVTSKIVALAEGRTHALMNEAGRERLIRHESEWAMQTKWTWLTIKDKTVMSSAGIDESNGNGKIILLPKDSFVAAARIRSALKKKYHLRSFGVLITDSRLLPLRAGVVGVALGYAGFSGVRDYRGTPDLFGRILKMSRTDISDGLATAAVLEMGEGAEQQPLAIITEAPVRFRSHVLRHELEIDPREDVYAPLFENIKKIKLPKDFKNGYAIQRRHSSKKRI